MKTLLLPLPHLLSNGQISRERVLYVEKFIRFTMFTQCPNFSFFFFYTASVIESNDDCLNRGNKNCARILGL